LVGDSPLFDRKEQSGVLVETGIAPAYAERLETWRRAFLNTDAVARHFVSPDAAWDSLVGPNDGGATHLAQRLAETVNPATKFNLLYERIVEIATELKNRIDEHRVSDDLAVEREKRLAAVREMLGAIADHVVEKGQLGHLLDTFVVDETDLRLIIRKATEDLDGASTRSPSRANSIFGSAGLGGGSASSPSEPQKPDVAVAAETVLTAWVSIFREVTGDPNWQRRLLVEPNHARGLADEFLRIAEHTGLAQRLAERFKSWKTLSGQARLQGLDILVAQIMDDLNNFAFYFGYNDIDPEGRPQLNSKAVHLFDRPTIVEGQFEVGDGDANFNDDLMDSWVLAFWLRANEAIQAEGPPDVDPEAQRELQRHSAHLAIG
ncbi:MAG: virulence factor SrfC family protein, partial [Pseudomonadota bacterium]